MRSRVDETNAISIPEKNADKINVTIIIYAVDIINNIIYFINIGLFKIIINI